jgi:hypothetical protein
MSKTNNYHNFILGDTGEIVPNIALTLSKLEANTDLHLTYEAGCDIVGTYGNNQKLAGEVLNWKCGGYIHPIRWKKIMRNLVGSNAQLKLLFCFGVKPTTEQYEHAKLLGIHIIHISHYMANYRKHNVRQVIAELHRVLLLNTYNIKKSKMYKAYRPLSYCFELESSYLEPIKLKTIDKNHFLNPFLDEKPDSLNLDLPMNMDSLFVGLQSNTVLLTSSILRGGGTLPSSSVKDK